MRQFEGSARGGDGLGVRRSFSRVINALADARKAIRAETGLHREHTRLPEWVRQEITTGLREGIPAGDEQMIAKYFRAPLAVCGNPAKSTDACSEAKNS